MLAQDEARAAVAERAKAFDRLWNKLRAKNKGKPPEREEWLKERGKLLKQLRADDNYHELSLSKEWIEAAVLWRELLQQFEAALVIDDDDFLNDLAKAIRGEAKPEPSAEFTSRVLVLLQKKAGATASNIFAALKSDGLIEKKPNGLKVAGRIFETKQRALDAIHDIATKVNHELARS
jgi:hypothetical protein